MGVLTTVKEMLRASTGPPNQGNAAGGDSKGAYWCHDCGERVRDVAVDGERPPACPDCGDAMAFERSPDSAGCAC